MKLKKKEKGKLGYKLTYHCKIRESTTEEVVAEFIKKEERWRKERAKSKSRRE
jgi:hypothetical protein